MSNNIEQNSKTVDAEIDLVEIIKTIWQGRKLIFLVTTIFVVIGVLYALLATPQYQAKLTLYPAGESQNGGLGKLGGLASSFGLGGMSSSSGYYIPDVVKSRKILDKVINKKWEIAEFDEPVNLIVFWELEDPDHELNAEKAFDKLSKKITVSVDDDSGLITISVETKNAKLSADIANYIGDEVNDYIQHEQKSSTRQSRVYIEERLIKIKDELKEAEENLKEFQKGHRIINESPELQMEILRLKRNVEIKNQVYLTLEQQREIALIEEIKQMPVLNILDKAVTPKLKTKPKKNMIVLISFILGVFISCMLIMMLAYGISFCNSNNLSKNK